MTDRQVAGISKMSYAFGMITGFLGQALAYAPDDFAKDVREEYDVMYGIWDEGVDMVAGGVDYDGIRGDGTR